MNIPNKGSRVLWWSKLEHAQGEKAGADLESKAGMCADVGGAIKACTRRDRIIFVCGSAAAYSLAGVEPDSP